jgi:hypothetical protein
MNRGILLRLLMVAGIAVAFAAGHGAGRSSSGSQDRDRADARHSTAGFVAGSEDRSLTRDVAAADSWEEVKARVVNRWEASPAPMVDYELRDETMRVLEKVPVADLEAWLRAIRPDDDKDDLDIPMQLREMILKVLARRGGSSFILSLAGNPTMEADGDVDDAVDHWLEHDPVAALDWMEGEVPEVIAESLDDYREDALVSLAGKDPAEFEKRLIRADSDLR